jgi:hypothetical protein
MTVKKTILLLSMCVFIVSCASPGPKKVSIVQAAEQDAQIKQQVDETIKSEEVVEKDGRKFRRYKIEAGDSLWKIAKRAAGSGSVWKHIADDNAIKEPYGLRPGRELLVGNDLNGKVYRKDEKKFEYRSLKNKAFGVGEKFVFAIRYFGITAGTATLEVRGIETVNGRETYLLAATAKTAPFFEGMYRVRDLITSNMDIRGLFSHKYAKKLEEGTYRNDSYMEFDHALGIATKKDKSTCTIPAFVQDVLSEFYYYRAVFTGAEKEIIIDTASDECKSYEVVVTKIGEEKVTVDAGEFDTWHCRPFLKFEGIFRQKGDVDIWFTKDENKIPVLLKSKIIIGTVDAILLEATVVKPE